MFIEQISVCDKKISVCDKIGFAVKSQSGTLNLKWDYLAYALTLFSNSRLGIGFVFNSRFFKL